MDLIILKSIKDGVKDAFISPNMTIGFPAAEGRFLWYVDGLFGEFSKCHAYLKYNKRPINAGIFKINDGNAKLYWVLGDINEVKRGFQEVSGFITDESVPEKEEIENSDVPVEKFEKNPDSFWDCNEKSFNEIINSNPENIILSELIPGSKWVNVTDDNYVLGIIYDENELPLYLCYGFPLPWSENPPEKLEGYCQWVPVDFQNPHDDGFWVIYINAQTGERVR